MGIFFEKFDADRCCLCGSPENLTGEHKVKASALRAIFARDPMVIGRFDGESEPRSAQGPKSSAFHFAARMCGACNSTRTQGADREFDALHRSALDLMRSGDDPGRVFNDARYAVGSPAYLNAFRYFAKLLACHIAESGGPRSIHLGKYATGEIHVNPIKLHLDADPTYQDFASMAGDHGFAAHGGLVVKFDRKTELPSGFHSTLTLGPLRYVYWVDFDAMMGLALKLFHQEFFAKCEAVFRAALEEPLSDHTLRQLGLN